MAEWKRPENIDKHPLRYAPIRDEIEMVLSRRLFEKRLDGYLLEASLEIADLLNPFVATLERISNMRGCNGADAIARAALEHN